MLKLGLVPGLVIVGLLASSTGAWARDSKYYRKQDLEVGERSYRVKPIVPRDASTNPPRPELGADDVLSIDGLVGDIGNEQEQALRALIGKTPDSAVERKSEYYFKLAKFCTRQLRYWRLRHAEATLEAQRTRNSQLRSRLEADADQADARTRDYLLKADEAYKALVFHYEFHDYSKMDAALFAYGYALQSGAFPKKARAIYDKLLQNYPSSRYAPEAHLGIADYLFGSGKLDDAEGHYRAIVASPSSPAYYYAMYRIGWIELGRRRFQDALDTFSNVAQATQHDAKQQRVNRASKAGFVRAFAEINTADAAYVAFQRVDAGGAFDMIEILAELYVDQGKIDKAIYLYRGLMKQAPTHKNVCLWQYNISHAMLSLPNGQKADELKEIENLIALWSTLKVKRTLPAAQAQECHDNAAAMSGQLARDYHLEWDKNTKSRNAQTLARAKKLYKTYLEEYPDDEDYPVTKYLHAELLWTCAELEQNPRAETEMWQSVAAAFTDVSKLGKLDEQRKERAAQAAVFAWKNALGIDHDVKQLVEANNPTDMTAEPTPIPPREQSMFAAFDVYASYIKYSADAQLGWMKFIRANIYRRYNHSNEAIPVFLDILEHHKRHETVEPAALLLLGIYRSKGRNADQLALAERLAGDAEVLRYNDALRTEVTGIKVQAVVDGAQSLEAEARRTHNLATYVACGQAYLDVYNAYPQYGHNDEMLDKAGVCFEAGKAFNLAIQAFSMLKRNFHYPMAVRSATSHLGKLFSAIAAYDRASPELEQFAAMYPSLPEAAGMMRSAMTYRAGIGDDQQAIDDTKAFVKLFGAKMPAEAASAMLALTEVYEKQGNPDAVIKHLREHIRQFGDRGGADQLVIAYSKLGQWLLHQSCPVAEVDGLCIQVTRERPIRRKWQKRVNPNGRTEHAQRCATGPNAAIRFVERDKRKSTDARTALANAIRIYDEHSRTRGGNQMAAQGHYALAKLAQADGWFELWGSYPDLDLAPALGPKVVDQSASMRLNAWLASKYKRAGDAQKKYEDVRAINDPETAIAASARIGQLSQMFAYQLSAVVTPATAPAGRFAEDDVAGFCDTLTHKIDALEAAALRGYSACLARSTELRWFSEWSNLCDREMGHIKPEEYPTASELRRYPDEVAPITELEPPAVLAD